MITKRSKVYVPYLYMQIKEQRSIPIYVKNKNGVGSNIIISKITLDFKCFQRTKQTETKNEGWDKRRKSLKLYNRNKICFLFPCLVTFHEICLLNLHKNCVCFALIL